MRDNRVLRGEPGGHALFIVVRVRHARVGQVVPAVKLGFSLQARGRHLDHVELARGLNNRMAANGVLLVVELLERDRVILAIGRNAVRACVLVFLDSVRRVRVSPARKDG